MSIEILIVDDEPNQIELMKFNLEKNGFLIKSAYNGEQALEIIYEKKIDLLIVDWMMPKMSGIELCRILRSNKDTKQLPIIMLSARSEDADKSLGLDTGADDYISKPFSPMELVSRVKALLRRSNTSMSLNELIVSLNQSLTLGDTRGNKYPVNDKSIVRVIKITPIPQLNSLGGL